jgi:PilZ domain
VSENQRAFFRIDASVTAVVRRLDADGAVWDDVEGETVDLSAGGVLLATSDYLPSGHRVEVELRSDDPPLEVTGRGGVVRTRAAAGGGWVSGVCFDRLEAQAERQLLRFCFLKEREAAERASQVRIDIAIPTHVECGNRTAHQASTVNVCSDGALITNVWAAERGEEVTLTFDERWFGRELTMRAQVRRRDSRGIDLAFCDPTRADRAAINQLVMAEERRRRTAA